MKKNISINISGIIFHIEEDGYETLKRYLDSINKYFSSYEDSEEIIADIESRIAEIFLEKLKDGNQVVSAEDVNSLIKTMGNISDFEAIEEEDDLEPKTNQKEKTKAKSSTFNDNNSKKSERKRPLRLYRDLQRKVLSGVAAGIANYYNFDPLWLRIGILFVLFGLVFAGPASSLVFIAYFVMWAVTPGSEYLEEDKKIKKLYRDPDDRVLGGVSSGLANYFGIEPLIIRIIFIVLAFGFGTGILAYLILWIITPSAFTITDKMQMKGEQVTLSNIDSNIKRSKEPDFGPKGEGTFTKLLLFPFRLIGKIFTGIGRAFAPLMLFIVAVIRILTGALISMTALSAIVTLIAIAGVFFGLYNGDWFIWDSDLAYFPVEIFQATVPGIGILFLMITVFIPFLYLLIAGITVIAKRRVMSSSVGWSILGIWFIAILGTFATLPNVVRDFRSENGYRNTEEFSVQADTLLLKANQINYGDLRRNEFRWNRWEERWHDNDDYYNNDHFVSDLTNLDIRVSEDDQFRVEERFRARGRNLEDAERNARMATYNYAVEGNEIIFDSELTLSKDAHFRVQEVNITFYIPEGRPFKIDRSIRNLLRTYYRFSRGYSYWNMFESTWIFEDGDLKCLTCEEENASSTSISTETKNFTLSPFSEIELSDRFRVNLIKSDSFKIELEGRKRLVDNIEISPNGSKLNLSARDLRITENESADITLNVYAPNIEKIRVDSKADLSIEDFETEFLTIWTFGDANLSIDSDIKGLDLFMSDNSRINLSSKVEELKADLQKGSRLYAYDASIEFAEVETNNDSRARLTVNRELNAAAGGFSSIRYKGNPTLNITDQNRSGTISKF